MANKRIPKRDLSFYIAVILLMAVTLVGILIILNLLAQRKNRAEKHAEEKHKKGKEADVEASRARKYVPKIDRGSQEDQNV